MGKCAKLTVGALVVMLLVVFLLVRGLESNMHKLAAMEMTDIELSRVVDGTYVGSYQAFPVSVMVEVTVRNHELAGVKLVEHRNGRGKAAEAVVDRVIEAQALRVDTVSGATYSSLVILRAIDNALAGAQQ
ncbi:MAG: FMN-binding protein [Firmicutes bacterium]|nr:FMN-binding protein [Bacillota bacterium]